MARMERPARFEHARFVGDKRTQLVYDLDEWTDEAVVQEFVDAGVRHFNIVFAGGDRLSQLARIAAEVVPAVQARAE